MCLGVGLFRFIFFGTSELLGGLYVCFLYQVMEVFHHYCVKSSTSCFPSGTPMPRIFLHLMCSIGSLNYCYSLGFFFLAILIECLWLFHPLSVVRSSLATLLTPSNILFISDNMFFISDWFPFIISISIFMYFISLLKFSEFIYTSRKFIEHLYNQCVELWISVLFSHMVSASLSSHCLFVSVSMK
uniref:Uncharacterized protein n=1 Tax=Rousettus aegyptiacus TaxID=9407 RepID=A0A7J8HSC8_ROUAE|nr:hypothetical protein HJG63_011086 [Rousettus aegyptiacus]